MYIVILVIFIIGYLGIAFEHPLKIDKAAVAMLMGVLCWTALMVGGSEIFPTLSDVATTLHIEHSLMEHLGETAGILFFLLGAMTIVELIDSHEGFSIITDKVHTLNRTKLLWILSILTFFFFGSDFLFFSFVFVKVLHISIHY